MHGLCPWLLQEMTILRLIPAIRSGKIEIRNAEVGACLQAIFPRQTSLIACKQAPTIYPQPRPSDPPSPVQNVAVSDKE